MVNWNDIFKAFRRTPTVGTPGMHLSIPEAEGTQQQPPETPTPPTPSLEKPAPKRTPIRHRHPITEMPHEPVTFQAEEKKAEPVTPQFFTPRQTPLTEEEKQAGQEAHRIRLANVTSSFEAPINPTTQMPDKRTPSTDEQTRGADVPLLMPSTRFYWCKGDRRAGLTVGYGTFFEKRRRLSQNDQRLLPSLQILNKRTRASITGNQPKADVIHELFPYVRRDEKLKGQPYTVSVQSADKMLRQRFDEKTTDLDRLLSNKGKRKVKDRTALVDWVASDMYYQGALSTKTGIPDFADNNINKKKLKKPNPENLRLTARRTCADLQDIIASNPFKPDMSEAERQTHARNLAEYCTAYTAHQMTRANPEYYYTRNHVQAHIQDLSSLAVMDIARNYYGRELSQEEIRQCKTNADSIATRIFSARNPEVYATRLSVAREKKVLNPLGHFRPSTAVLEKARQEGLLPEGTQPSQQPAQEQSAPSKGSNLSDRLRAQASLVPDQERSLPLPQNQQELS